VLRLLVEGTQLRQELRRHGVRLEQIVLEAGTAGRDPADQLPGDVIAPLLRRVAVALEVVEVERKAHPVLVEDLGDLDRLVEVHPGLADDRVELMLGLG
jgi:hypothetical protein